MAIAAWILIAIVLGTLRSMSFVTLVAVGLVIPGLLSVGARRTRGAQPGASASPLPSGLLDRLDRTGWQPFLPNPIAWLRSRSWFTRSDLATRLGVPGDPMARVFYAAVVVLVFVLHSWTAVIQEHERLLEVSDRL
jgi:hypothetical protein